MTSSGLLPNLQGFSEPSGKDAAITHRAWHNVPVHEHVAHSAIGEAQQAQHAAGAAALRPRRRLQRGIGISVAHASGTAARATLAEDGGRAKPADRQHVPNVAASQQNVRGAQAARPATACICALQPSLPTCGGSSACCAHAKRARCLAASPHV